MIERYIITSAINNTETHMPSLKAIETYAMHHNAEIIVLPIRYNPSHLKEEDIRWSSKLIEYIVEEDFVIGDEVAVYPSVNIRPTAVKPLTGLAGFSNDRTVIFSHPRVHLESVVSTAVDTLFNLTTGTISKPNYSRSKAGAKGVFHHTYGAVIVEIDTKKKQTHTRQVTIANNGDMIDINTKYNPKGVTLKMRAKGMIAGDVHVPFNNAAVMYSAYLSTKSLIKTVRPLKLVLHDIMDFRTKSHHNIGRAFEKYIVSNSGLTFMEEIKMSLSFIESMTKLYR